MSLILKSIEEEAADCRAANAHLKVGDWAWLVHHEILAEPLTEPIENRIKWILETKTDNVALRLRLLRPLVEDEAMRSDAELDKARAEWSKAIDEYYKVRAEWSKALDEYGKARAEYYKVRADWSKAIDEYNKVSAEYYKAIDEYNKVSAEYDKAYAEYSKAGVEYYKAYDEYNKSATTHYHRLFPDSPWNGKTIFAGKYAL
jgi:tetratricopeptide (TPR) repeat protein